LKPGPACGRRTPAVRPGVMRRAEFSWRASSRQGDVEGSRHSPRGLARRADGGALGSVGMNSFCAFSCVLRLTHDRGRSTISTSADFSISFLKR
jgi:hypothetical protein